MTMNGINLLWQEFKNFALKGNVIDLAVAVVIGGAFNKVITALVENVLMPLLSYISPSGAEYRSWHLGRVKIGAFLSETLNFLIIALALFFVMVKLFGALKKVAGLDPGESTTRECPFCLSNIPSRARKCAHCTADLPPDS